MITSNNLEAKLLATNLENMLNQSASMLELTSNFSEVKNTPYANSISPVFHGIPKNVDLAKRHIAQYILSKDKVLAAIFFAMPKGDVYLIEPFARQQNLTVNNLAFRDYFKGAVATHNTYLGGEIISVSAHRPTAVIAIPVYSSEKGGMLLGVWGGAINLIVLNKSLQGLDLNQSNQRVVYLDQHGNKIADSTPLQQQQLSNQTESFANLQSFKDSIQGKSGSLVESFNGTKMFIAYQPVRFAATTWAVLLFSSC
jgi:hypothetical protein